MENPLYAMLTRDRTSDVADLRDKLYAVLRLAGERSYVNRQLDYALSVEVYLRCTKIMISLNRSLDEDVSFAKCFYPPPCTRPT